VQPSLHSIVTGVGSWVPLGSVTVAFTLVTLAVSVSLPVKVTVPPWKLESIAGETVADVNTLGELLPPPPPQPMMEPSRAIEPTTAPICEILLSILNLLQYRIRNTEDRIQNLQVLGKESGSQKLEVRMEMERTFSRRSVSPSLRPLVIQSSRLLVSRLKVS
jgi:hypothetical protein